MVGWWTRDPNALPEAPPPQKRAGESKWVRPLSSTRTSSKRTYRLGPCAPVPASTRASSWVASLKEVAAKGISSATEAVPVYVPEVSPVWETLSRSESSIEEED